MRRRHSGSTCRAKKSNAGLSRCIPVLSSNQKTQGAKRYKHVGYRGNGSEGRLITSWLVLTVTEVWIVIFRPTSVAVPLSSAGFVVLTRLATDIVLSPKMLRGKRAVSRPVSPSDSD